MAYWRFLDYCDENGVNLIRGWYVAQDVAVRVAFDYALRTLEETRDWTKPRFEMFKVLTGKHVGLCEIRFSVEENKKPKRRFRPVGIWRPDSRDFILLIGCEKKMRGGIYIPVSAFDLAMNYKAQYEQRRGTTCEHIF